jgi:hypothetical protein
MPPSPETDSPGRRVLFATGCLAVFYAGASYAPVALDFLAAHWPALLWGGFGCLGWSAAVGMVVGAVLHRDGRRYELAVLRRDQDDTRAAVRDAWVAIHELECRGRKPSVAVAVPAGPDVMIPPEDAAKLLLSMHGHLADTMAKVNELEAVVGNHPLMWAGARN